MRDFMHSDSIVETIPAKEMDKWPSARIKHEINRSRIEDRIIRAIIAERRLQESKWGIQTHSDFKWMSILMEEVGEAAAAVNDRPNYDNQSESAKDDYAPIIEELIQVAAVAVAYLEDILYYIEEDEPDKVNQ